MSYPDQDINLATDARTNQEAPPVDSAAELARLRELWSEMPSVPKLLATRDEGEDNSWPGFDVRTLLRGEESCGRWSIHSIILAPGAELPPHTYDGAAYWFGIAGESRVVIGSEAAALTDQGVAYAPATTTQAIANRCSRPAEIVVAYAAAGSDRAFFAAHALWLERPESAQQDYLNAMSRYGFRFTQGGAQPGDDHVNKATPRVDGEIGVLDDLLALRERWSRLKPTPKLVRSPQDCYGIPTPNQETRVLVSPEESAGQASVFWAAMNPGPGAPPHHQPTEEELFIVKRGQFNLTVGEKSTALTPGGLGFAPRYCTHTFSNETDEVVVLASINSPGGHDRGFELISLGLPMERLFERMPAHGFQFHF